MKIAAALLVVTLAGISVHARTESSELRTAGDAIREAIASRLGGEASVLVRDLDVRGDARVFREARPDPSARLGRPIRFTLVTERGGVVLATATVDVVATHSVLRRDVERGRKLEVDDIAGTRGAIEGIPLRRLPQAAELIGARALRALSAGTVVIPGQMAARRAVEPGDAVTVVAAHGAIEVTAAMRAADGGSVGDVIRVVNADSKRYLRARVLETGRVEVTDAR